MASDEDLDQRSFFSGISHKIGQVPCARTAFLYGLLGGFGAGLTSFLLTSRVKRSADIGLATYLVGTLVTFGYCRYNRAKFRLVQKRYEDLHGVQPTKVSYERPALIENHK